MIVCGIYKATILKIDQNSENLTLSKLSQKGQNLFSLLLRSNDFESVHLGWFPVSTRCSLIHEMKRACQSTASHEKFRNWCKAALSASRAPDPRVVRASFVIVEINWPAYKISSFDLFS